MAFLAGACGGGGDDGDGSASGGDDSKCPVDALENADGKVEITVWSNFNALPRRTFEAMVKEYNTSQDRVVVDFQPQGVSFEEVLRKYKLAAEDDALPSLALLEDTTTQVMADSGTIIPGEACFDADPDGEAIKDDFLPIATASYSVDDQVLPVGFDVYTALIYYNRETFRAAGLDPDVPPTTLDEVRAAAQKIKDSGVGDKPVAVVAASWQTGVVADRGWSADRERGQRARRSGHCIGVRQQANPRAVRLLAGYGR
ncbi:MAG: extracellular solute-binding protein [Microthrixaceae bacterium]|nr:extracellular solute-binding protein [Microthrixaceae bacterium]